MVVETVCPDPVEHRRRVEDRAEDPPGWARPTWDEVRRTAAGYQPRADDRLVVDTTRPVAETLGPVLARLDGAAPRA